MTKTKITRQLRLIVPVSSQEEKLAKKLAKQAGIPVPDFLRELLLERHKSWRDAHKAKGSVVAKPTGHDRTGNRPAYRPAPRATKRPHQGRLPLPAGIAAKPLGPANDGAQGS